MKMSLTTTIKEEKGAWSAVDTMETPMGFVNDASTIEKGGDGSVIYDTRTEQGTRDVFGGAWPAGGFYIPTDFVQQNPRSQRMRAHDELRRASIAHPA